MLAVWVVAGTTAGVYGLAAKSQAVDAVPAAPAPAAEAHKPSLNGTTSPPALQIVDGSGNVWSICAVPGGPMVKAGAACENGNFAGASAGVSLLLYFDDHIYLGTIYNTWWSWTDGKWVLSKDPRSINGACGAMNGTTVTKGPTTDLCKAGVASAVVGTGPWTWTCAGTSGGVKASCSANSASVATSGVASPSGTMIPPAPQIVDSYGNVWIICALPGGPLVKEGAACVNGNFAGASAGVTSLLYAGGIMYLGTIYDTWWSWSNGKWVITRDPRPLNDSAKASH
jgi:hypothetical protein